MTAADTSPLTRGEQHELIAGHLAEHPFPAAVLYARYPGTIRHARCHGLTDDDIHAACLLGVVRAARRFDPARGLKFTTLLTWHLRNAVRNECRAAERDARRRERQGRGLVSLDEVAAGGDAPLARLVAARPDAGPPPDLAGRVRAVVERVVPAGTRRLAVLLVWGLGCRRHSQAEAGRVLGVSKQRVQQIEAWAVRKARPFLTDLFAEAGGVS